MAYSEIDKFASKSYSLIHDVGEDLNLGDIQKIDGNEFKDIDLITYGFPCTSISNAGKREGFHDKDGNKTQSGLFFDALRVIKNCKPRVAIAENVKALTSKRFAKEFEIVLSSLEEIGYNNYWKVLNTTDFNLPQNRQRVFIVSIRKDIDDGRFEFPVGQGLHCRLKDLLEDDVDEKYYLSDKMIKYITNDNAKWSGNNKQSLVNKSIASTINTYEGCRRCDASNYIAPDIEGEDIDIKPQVWQIGSMYGSSQAGRIYDKEGLCPTLNTMQGGHKQPFIIVKEATKKGYKEAYEGDSVDLQYPNSKTRRGRVGSQKAQTLIANNELYVVVKNSKEE